VLAVVSSFSPFGVVKYLEVVSVEIKSLQTFETVPFRAYKLCQQLQRNFRSKISTISSLFSLKIDSFFKNVRTTIRSSSLFHHSNAETSEWTIFLFFIFCSKETSSARFNSKWKQAVPQTFRTVNSCSLTW
jgi:hypothetical protein